MFGSTSRREAMEVYALAVLDELNVAMGGDIFRAAQLGHPFRPRTIITAIWRDIMTLQIERIRSCMETGRIGVDEIERMASRMSAYHPLPRSGVCRMLYNCLFPWRFAYRYPICGTHRPLIAAVQAHMHSWT